MIAMSDHNNTNWLGFSLSPHMNMEQNRPQPTSSTLLPSVHSTFFHSPHFTNSALCYGVEGVENGGFYSNRLSVMPLKSDGSLCIMEALTRSQQEGMVQSESPKLEDFLGCGPNMGTQQYDPNSDRETMALSLDSMYYSQDQESEESKNQNQNQSLELVQQQYFQPLHEMYQTPLGDELKIWANRLSAEVGYGDLNTLSLSMSPGTQSSCVTAQNQNSNASKKRGVGKDGQKQPVHRKSIDTFGQRTSQYRGVTRHRWTGRYEAHLWDNSCKKEGQTRKGRQVYLGGYDMEDKAARAYDLAALKYWGPSTHINFPLDNYHDEMEEMKNMSRQEYVAHLRRRSSGFSRGASMYRGVTRHHQHGRWQARIGRVSGNKDQYLGTFSTQEDAAEAYDIAAIRFRGLNAVTNFDISRYDTEKIMSSSTLLPAEFVRRIKTIEAPNTCRELPLSSEQIEHQPLFELGSSSQVVDHVSNSSSLVTSLSGSLDASPVSSWIPIANVPVFAAWSNVG